MVPADAVDDMLSQVYPLLQAGDIVIDGGNCRYTDTINRAKAAGELGLRFIDAGTSGNLGPADRLLYDDWRRRRRFRVHGADLHALAPENGYLHCGPSGAGHFVKMVHNGIEYGMMQAYAEGFELMDKSRYDLNLPAIAELWNQGSVIRSWLLELGASALAKDPALETVRGYVDDSGEGRWTVHEAVDLGVPANILAASLFARFASRDDNSFGNRMLAVLRREFGGHAVQKADD